MDVSNPKPGDRFRLTHDLNIVQADVAGKMAEIIQVFPARGLDILVEGEDHTRMTTIDALPKIVAPNGLDVILETLK